MKFQRYRRIAIAEMRAVTQEEIEKGYQALIDARVSISQSDIENGSPKAGDMIARNPKNHDDLWLIDSDYFKDNFELID